MKKLFLSSILLLLCVSCIGVGEKGLIMDKVELNGNRKIISKPQKLYSSFSSLRNKVSYYNLFCEVFPKNDTIFIMMLTLNEGKLQIDEGRKLLIKFEDESVMELSNFTRIGPADYQYEVTSDGTNYYVIPWYLITRKQIHELMTKKAVKVRIEHNVGQIDCELTDLNRLSKGMTAAYESIKDALSKNKNIYSDF